MSDQRHEPLRRPLAPPPAPAGPCPEQPGMPLPTIPPMGTPPADAAQGRADTGCAQPAKRTAAPRAGAQGRAGMGYVRGRRLAAALAAAAVLALPLGGCRSRTADGRTGASHSAYDDSRAAGSSSRGSSDSSFDDPSAGDTGGSDPAGSSSHNSSAGGAEGGSNGTSDSFSEGASGAAAFGGGTGAGHTGAPGAGSAPARFDTALPAAALSGTRAAAAQAPADWPLTLVNDSHPLPADYQPQLRTVAGSEKQLQVQAADALERMLADAKAAGVPCFLVSGYRSVRYQEGLFRRRVERCRAQGLSEEQAEAEAARWVARPGTSEHALGLAADIVSGDWYLTHDDLTEDFDETPQFAWLQANAARYGFILRYPADGEQATGVHYEPWHYRYVGAAAPDIAASGLTLEGYLARRA